MSSTLDTSHLEASAGIAPSDLVAWLPALDGVVDKLRSGAMVADVGAGDGRATIVLAHAFPRSAFTGYDLDAAAVATARRRAREAITPTASGRNVRFEVGDAAAIPEYAYDLVTTFEALHDADDPAAVARRVRRAIAEDGTWMLVEPHAAAERLPEILTGAGFAHVRIATATARHLVLEARP